jgi:alkanesulfonate monooxygenase SsuD/methylene tetrahydromethanopterin reductase-like flavin-dependent oxidoreductase (luciferase family)
MSERLAVGIIPGTGWRATEIQDVARAAEEAGFEAIFCTEVNNDSVATSTYQSRHLGRRHLSARSLSLRQINDYRRRCDRRSLHSWARG